MTTKLDMLTQTVGTLISWIGQSSLGVLSVGDCKNLISMLPPLNTDDMLDEAMQLHADIATGGLTGPQEAHRRILIARWKERRAEGGQDK